MKARMSPIIHLLLILLLVVSNNVALLAQHATNNGEEYITISGVIKDQKSKKKLSYASISIPGSHIGTITNEDGEFTLKLPESLVAKRIEISHLGYYNLLYPIQETNTEKLSIFMTPNENVLDEIIVLGGNAKTLVDEAIQRIGTNYSGQDNLLTGFYRETVKKRRTYINVAEAVIQIYKTSYEKDIEKDRVQVLKGRQLLSQKAKDTLIVKLQGGPNLSIYTDIVKNKDMLFDPQTLPYYTFTFDEITMIDDRLNYVIDFKSQAILPFALYYGKLYVDKENLTFTRAEVFLSMSDRNKATQAILRKKPFGLRFKPENVSFIITYKQINGKAYLDYVRNEVEFKCDWKRRLFATGYTILSEMVVTDRKTQPIAEIPRQMAFKPTYSLADQVNNFTDEDFWGKYNIIEPTESLENAVSKLKKQQK